MSETSKERRSRIDLSYHKRGDTLARWRGRLTVLAVILASVWVVLAPSGGEGKGLRYRLFQHSSLASKGPLARVHSLWETRCEACHRPFESINPTRWSPSLAGRARAGEEACRTCHAGPEHHVRQKKSEVVSCAECHRDHRGREASLLEVADAHCTSCHANLADHYEASEGALRTQAVATRFEFGSHPAFTLPDGFEKGLTGRIRFSHKRHLTTGLTLERGSVPFTFADLAPGDRARYGFRAGQEKAAVQLDCGSCHRLDDHTAGAAALAADRSGASGLARGELPAQTVVSTGVAGAAIVPPRLPGAIMLAVSYEESCRACHPLPFDPQAPDRQVRHGEPPPRVIEQIREFYAAQAVQADPRLLRRPVPAERLPGNSSHSSEQVQQAVDRKTLAAVRRFFAAGVAADTRQAQNTPGDRGGCVLCHELKSSEPIVNLEAAARIELQPVVIRTLWYESAQFNHTAHRAISCLSCHQGIDQAVDQAQAHLPDMANCLTCHAASGNPTTGGGAGSSCVLCHRYHNGEDPAAGLGAIARKGTIERTIDQFVNGSPASAK